jgi:hypothetical protein
MQATANEKQSASGGSMIINVRYLCIDSNKQNSENIPKGCCFFLSAASAERKKK